MAARTVVCPECSETLPYGRLSCPACGSLLASVAGGTARAAAQAVPTAPVPAAEASAPVEEAPAARPRRRWRAKANESPQADEPQTVAAAVTPSPARPASAPRVDSAPRVPALAPSKVGAVTLAARLDGTTPASPGLTPAVLGDWPGPDAQAQGGPSPWRRDGVQRPRDMGWDDALDGPRAGGPQVRGGNGNGAHATASALPAWAGGPRGSAGTVDWPAASAPSAAPAPVASPAPAADVAKKSAPPPGAYLPPSGTFTARDSGLARGQLVHPGSARVVAAPARAATATASANVPADEKDPKPRPGAAPLLADLPFDAPNSLPGWLIAGGSAAAVAGFLLPWSTTIPFASGFGYLDTWGLATPSHLLVLLATLVTLALAILPNRVPAWLRTGVAGLVLGALLLGITWPYLLDGFGAMIGALIETAAAMLMLIGGLLAVRPPRHAEDEPAV